MNKRGISTVVATVLLILIVVMAVMLIWIAILPMLDSWLYSGKVTVELTHERISILYVGPIEGSSDVLDIILERGPSELLELEIMNVTETINQTVFNATDVMLLVDLSGSMYESVNKFCMVGSINLNYSGSYCDSGEYICATAACDGTFSEGVCVNPTGNSKDLNCNFQPSYCTDCGGVWSYMSALDVLKEAAHDFVGEMLTRSNGSRISLLGFTDAAVPHLNFTNESDLLHPEIDSWIAHGSTDLLTGLGSAYNNFTLGSDAEDKFLIVLGDGGISDGTPKEATDFISNFVEEDITVHTIGFGPDANEILYQNIAAAGGGNYYDSKNYLDLAEQFRAILEEVNISHIVSEEVSVPGVFLDIAIFKEGDSYVHRIVKDVPGSNERRRYEIDLRDGWDAEDITKVKIYIVAVSRGNVENSVLLNSYDLR